MTLICGVPEGKLTNLRKFSKGIGSVPVADILEQPMVVQ
jgi:hypothetical protein